MWSLDWNAESPAGIQVAPESVLKVDSILHIRAWGEGLPPRPASELTMPGGDDSEVHGHTLTLSPCLAVSIRPAPAFLGQCPPRRVWPS